MVDQLVVGFGQLVRPLSFAAHMRSTLRAVSIVLGVFLLAGCATTTPNPILSEIRNNVYVDSVDVSWSFDDAQKIASNADYAAGRLLLLERLERRVTEEFQNSPSGSQAVRFEVDVVNYRRVGAAFGNIIGGSNFVNASVSVVRISDDAILGVYSATGSYGSNAGIIGAIAQSVMQPDIEGIMANEFAENLRRNFDRQ